MPSPHYKDTYVAADTMRSYDQVARLHGLDFVALATGIVAAKGSCVVADMGCGNSTFGIDLAERVPGVETIGLDRVSASDRNTYRDPRLAAQREITANCNSVPLPDESCDLIVSTWATSFYGVQGGFEKSPTTYISEAGRLLTPGGVGSFVPEHFSLDFVLSADTTALNRLRAESPFSRRKADGYIQLRNDGFSLEQDTTLKRIKVQKPF